MNSAFFRSFLFFISQKSGHWPEQGRQAEGEKAGGEQRRAMRRVKQTELGGVPGEVHWALNVLQHGIIHYPGASTMGKLREWDKWHFCSVLFGGHIQQYSSLWTQEWLLEMLERRPCGILGDKPQCKANTLLTILYGYGPRQIIFWFSTEREWEREKAFRSFL